MSFFNVLCSIFEKWPTTDLTNVIVSMCLVSYNFCMIPHVLTVTFGLNLSGAWGVDIIDTNVVSHACILLVAFSRKKKRL